jgi:hypothetical protein
VTSSSLFIFEEYVNVPSKSNEQKKKYIFCWRPEGHGQKEQDPDTDPLVRGSKE